MSESTSKSSLRAPTDSELLNAHRARKFTDQKNPKNPNVPKFTAAKGIRIRNARFVCYRCNTIFTNGWEYKASNLGSVALCEQCKTKIVPLKSVDVMTGAIQGGAADGGR